MSERGEWRIDPEDGKPHLTGWILTAIRGLPAGRWGSGWMELGVCPRCHATVITEGDPNEFGHGDQHAGHERWHAETDYPIPEGLGHG